MRKESSEAMRKEKGNRGEMAWGGVGGVMHPRTVKDGECHTQ